MHVSVYAVPPRDGEWVPVLRPYQFEPIQEGDQPVAIVEVPEGWMLVGQPHALLVRRTGSADFTSRTAADAMSLALARVDGFSFVVPPRQGVAGEINLVQVSEANHDVRVALAAPSSNGRAKALAGPKRKKD